MMKKKYIYVLFLFALSVLTAFTSQAQTQWNGRREIGNTQTTPAKYVGKLVIVWPNGKQSVGSGVLIGPHHVLTAGHAIYNYSRGGFAKTILFTPALHGQITPFAVAFARRLEVPRRYFESRGRDKAYDLGLISVNLNFSVQPGYMKFDMVSPSVLGRINRIDANMNGYDADLFGGTHQLMRTSRMGRTAPWSQEFVATWFSAGGASGGPVWINIGGTPTVIGINTVGFTIGNTSKGVLLNGNTLPWIKQFIASW